MDKNQVYKTFIKGIIFWGRITLLVAFALSFIPALYLKVVHGVMPPIPIILKDFGLIASIVVVSWIVEPIAYFPILGITGTYMAWLSGNISNLRVPVSAMSQEAAGVKEGTPEGDIVSTLGMGISVIINLVVLVIGVFFGVKLIGNLPPLITTAFEYILPAVFGAVLASFSLRGPKLAAFAFTVALVFSLLRLPMWIVLPSSVFGTIVLGVVMFNRESKRKISC